MGVKKGLPGLLRKSAFRSICKQVRAQGPGSETPQECRCRRQKFHLAGGGPSSWEYRSSCWDTHPHLKQAWPDFLLHHCPIPILSVE